MSNLIKPTIRRIAPQIAYILWVSVMRPVSGSTSARVSCIDAWSLAWMMRLLAELQQKKKFKSILSRKIGTSCKSFYNSSVYKYIYFASNVRLQESDSWKKLIHDWNRFIRPGPLEKKHVWKTKEFNISIHKLIRK